MNDSILVMWDARTLSYAVKSVRFDKRGLPLHNARYCSSPEEAAAVAIDLKRKAWPRSPRIVAPPGVKQYL